MMKTNSEIRAIAREELKDNWTNPVLTTFIYIAISGAISYIPLAGLFIEIPFQFAFAVALLLFIRGDKQYVINNMFSTFANYGRSLSVSLLRTFFVFLWTLLFFIPGIIKNYSYAMTFYIAQDNPELDANACINKSMQMMKGHKMDLFLLDLSFIGWILLGILSCGIGLLWVIPYMKISHAIFYQKLVDHSIETIDIAETTIKE